MTNQNKGSSRLVIAIVVLSILGMICLIKDISPAFASKHRCAKAGCYEEAAEGSAYCYVHKSYKSTYSGGSTKSNSSSSNQKSTSGTKNKTTTTSGSKQKSSSSKKSSSSGKTTKKIDPDDLDIEGYYEDYKDDFEDIDDAWDDLMDNPDLWEDYD